MFKSLFNWVIRPAIIAGTFAVIIVSGCQMLYDLWPVKLPTDLATYTNRDPNIVLTDIGKLQNIKDEAITKHVTEQLNLQHEMDKDKALYERAIAQANINIQQAVAERNAMIGTVANPGWLLGLALGATGLGSYFIGYRKQRPEDYTEDEHQKGVKETSAKAIELDRQTGHSQKIEDLMKLI